MQKVSFPVKRILETLKEYQVGLGESYRRKCGVIDVIYYKYSSKRDGMLKGLRAQFAQRLKRMPSI